MGWGWSGRVGRVGGLVDQSGSFSRVAGLSGLKNRGGGKNLTSLGVCGRLGGGAWTKKSVGGVAKEENNGRRYCLSLEIIIIRDNPTNPESVMDRDIPNAPPHYFLCK